MANKGKYNTKQRMEMQEFLKSTNRKHFTVADVCNYFKNHSGSIGTTTVYRHLDDLVNRGQVKKFFIDEHSSACFEYIGDGVQSDGKTCYHLKCEKCGKLIHLTCSEITEFEEHITKKHGFHIDPVRTVFYGQCEQCH